MSAGATPISAAVAGEPAAPVELKPAGVVSVDIVSAEIVPVEVVPAEVVNAEIVPADTVAAEVVNAELVPAVISAEIAPAEIVLAEFLSAVVVPAVAADAEIVPALVPAAGVGQGLTAPAANTIVAELRLPDLEPVLLEPAASEPREAVLREAVARTSVPEASVSDFDQLLTGLGGPTTSAEIPLPTRASLRGNRTAADSTADAPVTEPGARDLFTSPEIPLAPAGTDSASSWADDAKQSSTNQPPRKPFVPTTSARVPTQPAAAKSGTTKSGTTKKGARRLAAKGVTLAAMSFVALMAVATSLPAEALLSSSDVEAAAHEALQPVDSEPAQSLDIAGGTDTISVQRDGYESKSIAEVAAASGIRLEGTFTNNPNGTIQWPFAVGVHIGDHFGFRDCSGCSSDHGGQDFNPGLGAPIQAISDGVVSLADDGEGSLGVHMIIDHMIDGKPVSSVYAHMQHGSTKFKTGDVVKVGQVIGSTGTTGMSTGPHLHFEIRIGGKAGNEVDPLEWLYANVN